MNTQNKRTFSEMEDVTISPPEETFSQETLVPASCNIGVIFQLRKQFVPEEQIANVWRTHLKYYTDRQKYFESGWVETCIELYKYLIFIFTDPQITCIRNTYMQVASLRMEKNITKKSANLLDTLDKLLTQGKLSQLDYHELRMNVMIVRTLFQSH
jgi:hypothetical protein